MKKLIFPLVFLCLITGLPAESGRWTLSPFLTRLPGDYLILPDKPYALPYRGIEEIRFIDDYLLALRYQGEEHRAFYKFFPGDADNKVLRLTFQSGENLEIRLAEIYPGEARYEYRLSPDFFSPAADLHESISDTSSIAEKPETGEAVPASAAGEEEPARTNVLVVTFGSHDEETVELPAGDWTFTGTMSRAKD